MAGTVSPVVSAMFAARRRRRAGGDALVLVVPLDRRFTRASPARLDRAPSPARSRRLRTARRGWPPVDNGGDRP